MNKKGPQIKLHLISVVMSVMGIIVSCVSCSYSGTSFGAAGKYGRSLEETFVHRELQFAQIADISSLRGQVINSLWLRGNDALADLDPLRGMPLRSLDVSGTRVEDLTPLQGLSLTSLFLRDTAVSNLSPIEGMPLELLDIAGTKCSDLTPLRGMPLKSLYADRCSIERGWQVLEVMPLKVLHLDGANVPTWDFLYSLELEILTIDGGKSPDLARLKGKNWRGLALENLGIKDFSDLIGMTFVASSPLGIDLSLANNRITNIDPLLDLVQEGSRAKKPLDLWIDIRGNPINTYASLNALPKNIFVIIDKRQYAVAKTQLSDETQIRIEEPGELDAMRSGTHPGKDLQWFKELTSH